MQLIDEVDLNQQGGTRKQKVATVKSTMPRIKSKRNSDDQNDAMNTEPATIDHETNALLSAGIFLDKHGIQLCIRKDDSFIANYAPDIDKYYEKCIMLYRHVLSRNEFDESVEYSTVQYAKTGSTLLDNNVATIWQKDLESDIQSYVLRPRTIR